MKNNFKLILVIKKFLNVYSLPFLLLLFANLQNLNAQTCRITEFISLDNESWDTTHYSYDKKSGLLNDLTYPMYGGGYITEYRDYFEGVLISLREGGFRHDYFYNDKKQLEKITDHDDLGASNFYQEFTFDDQNRIIKHAFYDNYNYDEYVVTAFNTYRYEGDKKVIMEEYHDYHDGMKTPQYTYVMEYTDKLNPFFQPIAFPDVSQKFLAEKEVCTQYDGAIVDEYSYTRTCTYNKEGYPVECMIKYLDGTEMKLEKYTYTCK